MSIMSEELTQHGIDRLKDPNCARSYLNLCEKFEELADVAPELHQAARESLASGQ